jgi:phage-related protein
MGILKGATAAETVEQEGLDVAMDASPIGAIIVVVGLLAVAFAILILKCKPFREFWTGLWKDAKKIVREGIDWIKSHWKLLPAILLGPIGIAVTLVLLHFRQMKDGAERVVHDVISFFAGLPHRIVSALGDLGHLLLQGGINLVMGLVHGIESVAMAPVHAISSIVSDVRSFLPFSPAKKGPLSGSGSPLIAGAKIGQMLAAGITSSTSGVAASAHRMAGAAVITASGGAAGSGSLASALGGMSLQVKPGGGNQLEQLLVLVLRQFVRVNFGGDVQKAFGH